MTKNHHQFFLKLLVFPPNLFSSGVLGGKFCLPNDSQTDRRYTFRLASIFIFVD